jgi:hypothetical protein
MSKEPNEAKESDEVNETWITSVIDMLYDKLAKLPCNYVLMHGEPYCILCNKLVYGDPKIHNQVKHRPRMYKTQNINLEASK